MSSADAAIVVVSLGKISNMFFFVNFFCTFFVDLFF
jgi:hypothetical protein